MSNDNNCPETPEDEDQLEDRLEDQNEDQNEEHDQFLTDAEADADVLASAGWGTDEDYGCFGGDE